MSKASPCPHPRCNGMNTPTARFCAQCGRNLDTRTTPDGGGVGAVLAVAFGLILVAALPIIALAGSTRGGAWVLVGGVFVVPWAVWQWRR